MKVTKPYFPLSGPARRGRRGGEIVGYQYSPFIPPGIPIYLKNAKTLIQISKIIVLCTEYPKPKNDLEGRFFNLATVNLAYLESVVGY